MVTTILGESGAKDISVFLCLITFCPAEFSQVAMHLNEQITACSRNKPFAIEIYKITDSDTDANILTHVKFAETGNIN